MNARESAFESLIRCEKAHRYSNIEADTTIKRNNLIDAERNLYTALFYGVIEKRISLDYILSQYSKTSIEKLDFVTAFSLRIGLYQLLYMDRIPPSAACNESVELSKKYGSKGSASYTNAVLRSFLRKKKSIAYPDKNNDPAFFLSVFYGYPKWLCEKWISCYGEQKTEAIFKAFDHPPKITLRVNTLKITREKLAEQLQNEGIESHAGIYSSTSLHLNSHVPVSDLTCLKNGDCFVQDEASQICTEVLAPQKGESLIDTCACPGGKSFSSALWMENEGRILSLDLHSNKLNLVKTGAERLGIDILQTKEQNGTVWNPDFQETADKVLCDVPCSGLGIMAKKPDLRFKNPSDIEKLPEIQYKILSIASQYLKKGGRLVYSTCTLNPEENEKIVNRFLEENKNFSPCDFICQSLSSTNGMLTLFPDETNTDGFFIAKLQKDPK